MSQHNSARRTRLQLECLEDRCTPSTLWADALPYASTSLRESPASAASLAAGARHDAVPINLSMHITAVGSGVLNLTGNANHLGGFSGLGHIYNFIIDKASDRLAITGTATLVAANGDKLFLSFSVSLSLTTRQGEETFTVTGGTGRFTGASGSGSAACEAIWDPATPTTFECNGQGTGTLIVAHLG
jgi:hypothetical protein